MSPPIPPISPAPILREWDARCGTGARGRARAPPAGQDQPVDGRADRPVGLRRGGPRAVPSKRDAAGGTGRWGRGVRHGRRRPRVPGAGAGGVGGQPLDLARRLLRAAHDRDRLRGGRRQPGRPAPAGAQRAGAGPRGLVPAPGAPVPARRRAAGAVGDLPRRLHRVVVRAGEPPPRVLPDAVHRLSADLQPPPAVVRDRGGVAPERADGPARGARLRQVAAPGLVAAGRRPAERHPRHRLRGLDHPDHRPERRAPAADRAAPGHQAGAGGRGARGRPPRRAGAALERDPRHRRPGSDQHRAAAGGDRGRAPCRLVQGAEASGAGAADRAREPRGGTAPRLGAAPGVARHRAARRGAQAPGAAARRGDRHQRDRDRHRQAGQAARRHRGGAAADRPGGARQRAQALRRLAGRAHPFLHGGRDGPGRARRRRRLRPRQRVRQRRRRLRAAGDERARARARRSARGRDLPGQGHHHRRQSPRGRHLPRPSGVGPAGVGPRGGRRAGGPARAAPPAIPVPAAPPAVPVPPAPLVTPAVAEAEEVR
jgi:hypothetical protein